MNNLLKKQVINSIILLSLVIGSPINAQSSTIFLPPQITQETVHEKIGSHDIEFAFDIHDVILTSQKSFLTVWEFPNKLSLFKVLLKPMLVLTCLGLVAQLIIDAIPFLRDIIPHEDITGERFVTLFEQAGEPELAQLVITISNCYDLNPEVATIIGDLKSQNYTLRVASNIGKTVFAQLQKELTAKNENIFMLFDTDEQGRLGKIIDYTSNSTVLPKPHKEFFKEYQESYNPDGIKLIIFIDDKDKNIQQAVNNGFVGIHFIDAQQLKNDLIELGITI